MKAIIVLLSIGASIVLMGLIVLFIVDFIEWLIHSDNKPRIKFTQFKKIYDINPNRWVLYDKTVGFCESNSSGRRYSFEASEQFRFGYIDHFRYYAFKNKLDKIEMQKKESKALLSVIEAAKKDIAEFEERNKEKMKNAFFDIQKVTDNINRNAATNKTDRFTHCYGCNKMLLWNTRYRENSKFSMEAHCDCCDMTYVL